MTKWNSLGLPRHNGRSSEEVPVLTVLELAWGLPFLGPRTMAEGVREISTHAEQFERNYELIVVFTSHLKNYWLPLANIMSIREVPSRNNPIYGPFNMHIVRLLGMHQPLFKFLGT